MRLWNSGLKIEQLRKLLEEKEIDALLITNSYNRRYMTNFTGSAGAAIISRDDAVFITDFRYMEQANAQLSGYRIVQHTSTMIQEVANQVKEMKIGTLGFEKEDMSYGQFELYDKHVG